MIFDEEPIYKVIKDVSGDKFFTLATRLSCTLAFAANA